MALVNIGKEVAEIREEMRVLGRIKFKLNNQMRHYKEMNRLRMISSRTNKFLREADKLAKYTLAEIDCFSLDGEVEMVSSLKDLIISEGHLVQNFILKGYLLQFSILIYGVCSKMYAVLGRIQKKLAAIHKIQNQRKKKLQMQVNKRESQQPDTNKME